MLMTLRAPESALHDCTSCSCCAMSSYGVGSFVSSNSTACGHVGAAGWILSGYSDQETLCVSSLAAVWRSLLLATVQCSMFAAPVLHSWLAALLCGALLH
jgi:hypothetical protein